MTEELRPKRRTKLTPEELEAQIVAAKADPDYVSPLREPPLFPGGEPQDSDYPSTTIIEQAIGIFDPVSIGAPEPSTKKVWTPRDEHMIEVRGGAKYLPARRRVQWMRQEPEPHPEWSIKTTMVNFIMGEIKGPQKIAGGYASFKAEIFDEYGRLISTGHAQEFSENFFDYLEKAETSAVARALALAGYGTESALDLDEGFIADSPFKRDGQMGGDIKIESSNVPGMVFGGRSTVATEPQLDAIRRRARELTLDPEQLAVIVESVSGEPIGLDQVAVKDRPSFLINAIRSMTFDQAAAIVQMLLAADDKIPE